MKNPVRSILLFAVLSMSSALVFAAPQQTPAPAPAPPPLPADQQRDNPRIAQRLALSHDQQVQFRDIHKDQKAQLDAVQTDPSLSPRARRQKAKEIRANTETRIRAMLNQNQQDEWDQIKRERQEAAARRRETSTAPPQQ